MEENKKFDFKKILKVAIPILLVLLVLGGAIGFIVNSEYNKKLRADSYKNLDSQLVVTFIESSKLPEFEAGTEFTYKNNDIAELKYIPDQFKGVFKKVPAGATIRLRDADLSMIGEKTLIIDISMTDQYGQLVEKEQSFVVNVVDNTEPKILLEADSIKVRNEDDIKKNVRAIVDENFGEYQYSISGGNHTYYIDMGEINWGVPGDYQVNIIINDNGKIREYYFMVTLGELIDLSELNLTGEEATEPTDTQEEQTVTEQQDTTNTGDKDACDPGIDC